MASWQAGTYNADYIIYNHSLIGQLKFIASSKDTVLEELCVERFLDGQIAVVFTIKDNPIGQYANKKLAKMALNNLFNELNLVTKRTSLDFRTTNEDIHVISASVGQERLISQVLNELVLLDPTLLEIKHSVDHFLSPEIVSVDPLTKAIKQQENRLDLLRKVAGNKVIKAKSSYKTTAKSKTVKKA